MQENNTTKHTIESYPAAVREWHRAKAGEADASFPEPPPRPPSFWDHDRLFIILRDVGMYGASLDPESPYAVQLEVNTARLAVRAKEFALAQTQAVLDQSQNNPSFVLRLLCDALDAYRADAVWFDAVGRRGEDPQIGTVPILVTPERLRSMSVADRAALREMLADFDAST